MIRQLLHDLGIHWWKYLSPPPKTTHRVCRICGLKQHTMVVGYGHGIAWVDDMEK